MSASGKLRHWLTFQTLVSDQDSDGATVEEWSNAFATSTRLPCWVEYLSGRELLAAQSVASRVTHRITARYRPGFDAVQRATHPNGTVYNIEAVLYDNDSGVRWVRLLATTGTNEGGTAT